MSGKRKGTMEEKFTALFRDFLQTMSMEDKERAFSTFKEVVEEEEERLKWDQEEIKTLDEDIPLVEEKYKESRRKKRKLHIEFKEVEKECVEYERRLDFLKKRREELLLGTEDTPSEVYLPPSPSLEGFEELSSSDDEGEESENQAAPIDTSDEKTEVAEGTTIELRILDIPTYTFRGSFCFHCGAHDKSLMTKNDGDDWDMFVRGVRKSRLWLAARKRLSFPSDCTCTCAECNMSPEYCMCDSFSTIKTWNTRVEDYVPKVEGKTKYTYVPQCMKTTGILDMSFYRAILEINAVAKSGDVDAYKTWYEAIRVAWKRYVHHVNTVESLETYVYLAYLYSETVRFDTYCAFMYCDFEKGSRGRNHCSAHRRQIMGKETVRCPWMVRGKERFDAEK